MAVGKNLPGTGRGTMQSMAEGHVRQNMTSKGSATRRRSGVTMRCQVTRPVPFHHLRWSPSPKGEDL